MYINKDSHKITNMATDENSAGADSFRILPLAEHPECRDAAMEIFYYSFPENEQTDISHLPELLPPEIQFTEWVLVYEQRTVGYLVVLFTDDVAYPLHLAVAEGCRGKGFGTRAMEFVKRRFASQLMLFAVEPPSEEAENQKQRLARIRLYERLGFRLAGIDIFDGATLLTIMCRSSATEEEIRKIRAFLGSMLEYFGGKMVN